MSLRAVTLALSAGLPAVAPLTPSRLAVPAPPANALGDFRSRAEIFPVTPRAAAPQAAAQLQAAQPPAKPGPTDEQRAFYERVFSGAAAPKEDSAVAEPPEPGMDAVKADTEKLLTHLSKTPTAWRGPARIGEALARRTEAVAAAGGIARREPKGLFSSTMVVEPLEPAVLDQLSAMAATFRLIARSQRADFGDLLYSVGVLTGRAATREAFAKDLAWLFGTYRLGR